MAKPTGINRREFVSATALAGAGVVAAPAGVALHRLAGRPHDPTGSETVRDLAILENVEPSANEDVLLRMQRELVRAMGKPVEERRWVMVIDTRKCVGCVRAPWAV